MAATAFVTQVLDIIASEAGMSADELEDETEFSDLGFDAILSKVVTDRVAESSTVKINPDVFQTYNTVESLREYLVKISPKAPTNGSSKMEKVVSPTNKPTTQQKKPSSSSSSPPLAIRLQGDPSKSRQNLFLLPDGSGMGMAYMQMPALGPDICLYGLNSPYLTTARKTTSDSPTFGTSLEEFSKEWIGAIRSIQPKGPYLLGGWSAGGYYAFEVTKQLLLEGDSVAKIILIDSPCRLVFEALPMEVVRHLSSQNLMGNWGTKDTPEWLVRHFDATIKAVEEYVPTPISPSVKMPEVFIIWATEGVFAQGGFEKSGLDLNIKVSRFLLENRPQFGPLGWDDLFPGARPSIGKMKGNHFAIVHEPYVSELGSLLRDAVQSDAKNRKNQWL